jgi:hypothetical protein
MAAYGALPTPEDHGLVDRCAPKGAIPLEPAKPLTSAPCRHVHRFLHRLTHWDRWAPATVCDSLNLKPALRLQKLARPGADRGFRS